MKTQTCSLGKSGKKSTESLYRIELKKIKGRKIGLAVIVNLAVQLVWLMACVRPPLSAKDLEDGYQFLLINLPTLNMIFFPLLMAMIASRCCEIEQKGNNLKLLYTMMDRKKLFDLKFLIGFRYILFIFVSQVAMVLVLAKIIGFTARTPWFDCIWIPLTGFIMNIAVYLLQEILSFWFENQMIPLAIGLFGSFFGIMSVFIPQIRELGFWSFYLLLGTVNMSWDVETKITTYYTIPIPWDKLCMVFVIIAILYPLGKWFFTNRKEV